MPTPAEAHRARLAAVEMQTYGDTRHYNVGGDIRRVIRDARSLVSFQWCQHHKAETALGAKVEVTDPLATRFNVAGAFAKVTAEWGNRAYGRELRVLANKLMKEVLNPQDLPPTNADKAVDYLNRLVAALDRMDMDHSLMRHIRRAQHRFPRNEAEGQRLLRAVHTAANDQLRNEKAVRAKVVSIQERAKRLAEKEMLRWKNQTQLTLPAPLRPDIGSTTKQDAFFGRR